MWNIYNANVGEKTETATEYEVIEDPEYLFKQARDEIEEEAERVMAEKGMRYEEWDQWVKKTYPDAYQRLWGELYERINTDIWGKYRDGILTQEELERWKERLGQWKGEWLEILKSITNEK